MRETIVIRDVTFIEDVNAPPCEHACLVWRMDKEEHEKAKRC